MLEELFSLDGHVALATRGNGGSGRAMALGLNAAGARVAVTGRDPHKNARMAAELGPDDAVYALDVRDEDAVNATIAALITRFGQIDILVNNAGLFN